MDKTTLKHLIGKMNRSELTHIISLMAQVEDAEQILLDYCQMKSTSENITLIQEKQLKKHWMNAYRIIVEANEYGGCCESDEDDVCYEIEILQKILTENEISWIIRKEILDNLLEQVAYDNSGFTDILVDLAAEICRTIEEKEYLADFLAGKGNNYYKGYAATIYRDLGLEDKFLGTKKANLRYGSDFIELAKYYMSKGEVALSLQTAWEGLDQSNGDSEIYQYLFQWYQSKNDEKSLWKLYHVAQTKKLGIECITELMYRYCKKKEDYPNQMTMLLNLMSCCDSSHIAKWYQSCRDDFSTVDWQVQEPILFEQVKKKNTSAYLDICLDKGKKEEVLKYIISHSAGWNSIDSNHRYSKTLAKDYPNEILKLYWNEVNQFIGMGKEKNYYSAVAVMKEIRTIMRSAKRTDEWNRQLTRIMEVHSRKKLLLQAIANKL